MKNKLKKLNLNVLAFVLLLCSTLIIFHTEKLYAAEDYDSVFIKKVSQSYTRKFCNAIGFGLSKDSAMNFSLKENNQVFNKKKEFKNINKELMAEEIAIAVVEKCGYPINLSGDKGITEFKDYYLSKDNGASEDKQSEEY
tara:strand:+ start:251 stop:670 length:420 start_codon:yes stop_codon:yes gene_type:complete